MLGVGVTSFVQRQWTKSQQAVVTTTPTSTVATSTIQTAPTAPTWRWIFTPQGENSAGVPQTQVTLVASTGQQYEVGIAQGNCFVAEKTAWGIPSGQQTGAICYFAGAGDEFGVFTEGNVLVLKKGIIEEGNAETPGVRGNFVTMQTL